MARLATVLLSAGATALGLLAATLTGVAPAAAQTPIRGGTLDYAVVGQPQTQDCHASNSFTSLHYVAPHYSLLVKFDPDTFPEVKGDIAESWMASTDGLAYTFKLRPGVVFHDGTALTSTDIKVSFDRLRAPPAGIVSANQALFQAITAIDTPDAGTVVFKLSLPQSYFLAVLANPFACIYSAAKLAEDQAYPAKQPMGTGPFVFVEHVPGSHWKGKRFDRYFIKDRPYLDDFRAVTFSQNSAVATALQSNQVQAEFRGFPPAVRDRLKEAMGDKLSVQESVWALSIVLTFNAERAPFNDPRVRRALNMAIDRWSGAANLAKIASVRSIGASQRPGSPWAATDAELTELPGFQKDMVKARAEAKRLLAEAGHPALKFKLINRNLPDPYVPLGVFLIDQWRQIGVTVEHQLADARPWQQAMITGEFEAMIEFSNALVDDPELEFLKYISRDRSQLNIARYIDRDLDGIFDKIVATSDTTERRKLTRAFETRLYDQSYMMPVLWMQRLTLMSSRLQGWRITPSHLINQDLTDVWLKP